MNPQPDPVTGQIIAMVLVLVVPILMMIAWNNPEKYAPKEKSNWDLFKLGEIYEEEDLYSEDDHYHRVSPTNIMRAIDRAKKPPTKKSRPKPSPEPAAEPNPKDHPLFDDCVSALVSLGHKKTLSKNTAAEVLTEFNPSSIEEFIKLAYRRKT